SASRNIKKAGRSKTTRMQLPDVVLFGIAWVLPATTIVYPTDKIKHWEEDDIRKGCDRGWSWGGTRGSVKGFKEKGGAQSYMMTVKRIWRQPGLS
ncbi:hypothetical protein MKW98_000257, partial [Papaver atlanticum]